ncbi:MAG: 16S rRNA (guanine(527)-N(7))-methyltransferase RsmG [Pseudomonadota bacterium]
MKGQLEGILGHDVSRETLDRLELYETMLREEAARHNLVSRGTLDQLRDRHVLDSAQLLRFEPRPGASWIDIGSGAGLPGIVLAILGERPVTLVEPRRLRAEFLHKAVRALNLSATVLCMKAERVEGKYDVITARAVAPLDELLKISHHLSTRNSVWVLPKGRNAESEVAEAKRAWQGVFHVERSVTDADSGIVVAREVKARGR